MSLGPERSMVSILLGFLSHLRKSPRSSLFSSDCLAAGDGGFSKWMKVTSQALHGSRRRSCGGAIRWLFLYSFDASDPESRKKASSISGWKLDCAARAAKQVLLFVETAMATCFRWMRCKGRTIRPS